MREIGNTKGKNRNKDQLCIAPLHTYCMLYVLALSNMQHLILAIAVVFGEWVNLVIVGAWHYCTDYIVVSLSSDKCTYCKSLWIKASAKRKCML